MTKAEKCIGLHAVVEGPDHQRLTHWIFDGTEHLVRYPKYNFPNPTMGIDSYGSIVVKGYEHVICYRASAEQEHRLAECGWRTVGRGTHYVYVTRGDAKLTRLPKVTTS